MTEDKVFLLLLFFIATSNACTMPSEVPWPFRNMVTQAKWDEYRRNQTRQMELNGGCDTIEVSLFCLKYMSLFLTRTFINMIDNLAVYFILLLSSQDCGLKKQKTERHKKLRSASLWVCQKTWLQMKFERGNRTRQEDLDHPANVALYWFKHFSIIYQNADIFESFLTDIFASFE